MNIAQACKFVVIQSYVGQLIRISLNELYSGLKLSLLYRNIVTSICLCIGSISVNDLMKFYFVAANSRHVFCTGEKIAFVK